MGYLESINELELCDANEWKGDVRNKLIKLFEPILEGSVYRLEINTGDKGSKIIDVYKEGIKKRVLLISQKKDLNVDLAFSLEIYDIVRKKIDLPDNQKEYRSQPHIRVSLKTAYNVLCVMANKQEMMAE